MPMLYANLIDHIEISGKSTARNRNPNHQGLTCHILVDKMVVYFYMVNHILEFSFNEALGCSHVCGRLKTHSGEQRDSIEPVSNRRSYADEVWDHENSKI